ncbi:MAG TPA: roadblock/LC7 domain-containing protein [Thermomicrobiales bacterium]
MTTSSVDDALHDLLRYDEILGVVAVNIEGLVMGRAGIDLQDADVAGAVGAALVGATERTALRLGAGPAQAVSIATPDGMIHVQNAGNFALIVFSEPCEGAAIRQACQDAIAKIEALLQPAA